MHKYGACRRLNYSQLFVGQVMGTAVGSLLFTKYGWRPSAAVSLAWAGFMLFAIFLRGPNLPCYAWLGYAGGIRPRRREISNGFSADEDRTPVGEIQETESRTEALSRTSIGNENPSQGPETQMQEKANCGINEKGPNESVVEVA